MIPKTKMTIDAYLRQSGLKPNAAERAKNFIPLKQTPECRFGEVLDEVQSTENPTTRSRFQGKTIADYQSLRSPSMTSPILGPSWIRSDALNGRVPNRHRIPSETYLQMPAAKTTAPENEAPHTNADAGAKTGIDPLIDRSIEKAAKKYNLSAKLIESIIRTESNFQPKAVSPAGAQGLMQLMPATARELGIAEPFDVQENIDGGARYFRQMLDRFGGDVKLALAAYNAGPGTVARCNGDVPFKETRHYIQRVLAGIDAGDKAPT